MTDYVARENEDLAEEIVVLQEEKDLLLWLHAEQQYRIEQIGREVDAAHVALVRANCGHDDRDRIFERQESQL